LLKFGCNEADEVFPQITNKEVRVGGLLGLVILVLDIIAIIDIVKSSADTGKKILWLLLVILLPVLGMILYFLLGKKSK
jgi:hypothetical protein